MRDSGRRTSLCIIGGKDSKFSHKIHAEIDIPAVLLLPSHPLGIREYAKAAALGVITVLTDFYRLPSVNAQFCHDVAVFFYSHVLEPPY